MDTYIALEIPIDQELENILNHPAPAYGEQKYWNDRYENDSEQFEWFLPWSQIRPNLDINFKPNSNALVVGCGSSSMSYDLLQDVISVVSIDFSDVIINKMKEKYQSCPGLEWKIADCLSLPFQANTFNYIFDKATIDTMRCDEKGSKSVNTALKEIHRVLKPGGIFVVITYGIESTRNKDFEAAGFNVSKCLTITGSPSHYIYVCTKAD